MRLPHAVVVLVSAAGLLAAVVGEPAPPAGPLPVEERPERVPPRPPDWDLEQIRDIFRYADDVGRSLRPAISSGGLDRERPTEAEPTPGPPPGPRLVGLIRGSEGLKAAIAAEGEVLVLERGASALGYVVVDVDEEGALLRDPDGALRRLSLEPTGAER